MGERGGEERGGEERGDGEERKVGKSWKGDERERTGRRKERECRRVEVTESGDTTEGTLQSMEVG